MIMLMTLILTLKKTTYTGNGDDINLKRRKISIAISLNSLLNLEGSNYFRYPIVRKPKGNFHRDRDAIMRWVTILDDIM